MQIKDMIVIDRDTNRNCHSPFGLQALPKTSVNTWATLSGTGVFIDNLEFNLIRPTPRLLSQVVC